MNNDLDFKYGSGTQADYGCAVTLKGQFWYLGGSLIIDFPNFYPNKRQVNETMKRFFQSMLYLVKQNNWL